VSNPFLAEIKVVSFNFAPRGWALCNGQLLPINQNQALFALLGTTYGGDGRQNFGLPNLQGRTSMHAGQGHVLGEKAGETQHTVSMPEMPLHTHSANATSSPATTSAPSSSVMLAQSTASSLYGAANNLQPLAPISNGQTGGSQAHTNTQPYLVLNFVIALQGIFPSRN
jgi:microcystin-dependent protein